MAWWCAATGQPAESWLRLTRLEHQAFMEVAKDVARIRARR